ncbi:MAG: peptidylprolyl isomerase [Rubrivivax sp.]|nr:peptidylprolyl isomerase [Rubrivivax sp.]
MFRRIAISLALLGPLATQAQVSDHTPVIEASGLSITKADFEQMLSGDPRFARAMAQPEAKLALGTDFGKAFALEAEARKRKLEQSPSVQLKIRNYTTQLLANELLVSLRKGYLKDDAALAALYEKNKEAYAEPRVRQILVRMQGSAVALRKGKPDLSLAQARTKAEVLRAKLASGADFAALARAESDDLGSIKTGGDIGFVPKGTADAEFEAVAFSLPVGTTSGVIKTGYGFHLIRVEERRPMALEAVKEILANELAHRDLDGIILNGYKLNLAYFGK